MPVTYTVTRRDLRAFSTAGGDVTFTVRVGTRGADGAAGPNVVSDTTALGTVTLITNPLYLLVSQPGPTPGFVRGVSPGAGTGGGLSLLLAANNAAVLALLGTGTPGSGNFLRGDGSWQTVSASPGGTDTQVQFNDGGAFGGDAGLTYSKATDTLSITGSCKVTLDVRVGGSGNLFFARGRGITFVTSPLTDGFDGGQFLSGLSDGRLEFTGAGLQVTQNGTFPGLAVRCFNLGAGSTTVYEALTTRANGSGTGGGSKVRFEAGTSAGASDYQPQGELASVWADGTSATRAGRLLLTAYYTTTSQEGLRVEGNSAGVRIGFFGVAAVARKSLAAAATDLATVIALANDIRAKAIDLGLFS